MEDIIALMRSLSGRWKHFRPAVSDTTFLFKLPLDEDKRKQGLEMVQERFPELMTPHIDHEKRQLSNRYGTTNRKHLSFRMDKDREFTLAWGPDVEDDYKNLIERFMSVIRDGFRQTPANLEWLDLTLSFTSRWEGQHYEAIWDAFLKNSPLSMLFQGNKVLQDDIKFRAMIDDNRVCILKVQSTVSDEEVLSEDFSNDLLIAQIGVAHVYGVKPDKELMDLLADHCAAVIPFVTNKFLPTIVDSLDNAIEQLSQHQDQ